MLALQKSKQWMTLRAKKLKEDICMLFKTSNDTVVKMSLVDKLQHLGIDHLFEDQIDTAMWQILKSEFSNYNLYEVALRFRLLREHGHWVSPGIYNPNNFFLLCIVGYEKLWKKNHDLQIFNWLRN